MNTIGEAMAYYCWYRNTFVHSVKAFAGCPIRFDGTGYAEVRWIIGKR